MKKDVCEKVYEPPLVEVVSVQVEQGYGMSGENSSISGGAEWSSIVDLWDETYFDTW